MPKMKTRKCVAKRIKQTATGKFVRKQGGVRHLNGHKTAKRKMNLGQDKVLDTANEVMVKHSLPYGLK